MDCTCDAASVLTGNAADDYAVNHLTKRWVNPVAWMTGYECERTGLLWLRDSPQAHLHGGGPPRLRQASRDDWDAARDQK